MASNLYNKPSSAKFDLLPLELVVLVLEHRSPWENAHFARVNRSMKKAVDLYFQSEMRRWLKRDPYLSFDLPEESKHELSCRVRWITANRFKFDKEVQQAEDEIRDNKDSEWDETCLGAAIYAPENAVRTKNATREMLDVYVRLYGAVDELSVAARLGVIERVQELINIGSDVNANGHSGPPLCNACERGHEEVARRLVAAGANIATLDTVTGNSALAYAANGGYQTIVKMLVEAGADLENKALVNASQHGDLEIVEILLDAGADIEARFDPFYESALSCALYGRHARVVERLLVAGAKLHDGLLPAAAGLGLKVLISKLLDEELDLSERGHALQCAAENGHVDVVEMLIRAGADVNTLSKSCEGCALHAAIAHSHVSIVRMLIAAGADVNMVDRYGSAIQAAASQGSVELLEMVIAAGADVNARHRRSDSALQRASYHGDVKMVEILLSAGAEVDAEPGVNGSALSSASFRGRVEVVGILINAGAVISQEALEGAVREDRVEVVKMLIGAKADFDLGSALKLARSRRSNSIADMLVAAGIREA